MPCATVRCPTYTVRHLETLVHLSTRLDCDLVAVEQDDELTLLVELNAPAPSTQKPRQPATLQIVLDRSGSMGGGRLTGATAALSALVDRLDPRDNLGVVAFDDHVQVVAPTAPLTHKAAVKEAISAVHAGGSTDLSAGYLRGLQEALRAAGPAGATVLLVSDGHANAGVTDAVQLGNVAAHAHTQGVTTSTLGFGLGYDERLLAALARGGAGNELFAEEADTAVALISGEVDGLLAQVAQAALLRLRWTPHIAGATTVLNELSWTGLPDGFLIELGSFYAGETRRLLIHLQVPGIAALGLAQVATLELTHVALPELVQHTTTLPLHVNVVPGDQAAGRVPDPEVRSEALFQQTQQAKRRSGHLLSEGRVEEASRVLRETSAGLRSQAAALPEAVAVELFEEAELVSSLADEAEHDSRRAAKVASTDASMKSRTRGRHSRGGQVSLRWASGSRDVTDSCVLLEEWEVARLTRGLPPELVRALRPSHGDVRPADTALELAGLLGGGHPLHHFLTTAAAHGGFTVERA
jgi:Ca-activated chloride channel homolog